MSTPLNQRSQSILKSLIEHYIRDGQPVGSKKLAQDSELMVSSATIRTIMSELEAAGYLASPHTSAGRIPTAQGYRLFVDHFLTVQPLPEKQIHSLRSKLDNDTNAKDLVARASNLLSDVTKLAGVVTLPKREKMILRHVEFLPLSEKRVLVILVLNNHEVQNRVMSVDRDYSPSELEQAGNFLVTHYGGKDLLSVRESLLAQMRKDQLALEKMMQSVMEMAEQASNDVENNYVLSGEGNLFSAMPTSDYAHLQALFQAFSQQRDVLHLLDQSLGARGIQIFIGEESGYDVFDQYSVVTSPYQVEGNVVGVLGVIGPKRMAYDRVISAVDVTAKLLSQALGVDE